MPNVQAQRSMCPQNSSTFLSKNRGVKGRKKVFHKFTCFEEREFLSVSSKAKRKFMNKRVIPRDSLTNFWQNFSLPPFCWCCANTISEIKFLPAIWKNSTFLKVTIIQGGEFIFYFSALILPFYLLSLRKSSEKNKLESLEATLVWNYDPPTDRVTDWSAV